MTHRCSRLRKTTLRASVLALLFAAIGVSSAACQSGPSSLHDKSSSVIDPKLASIQSADTPAFGGIGLGVGNPFAGGAPLFSPSGNPSPFTNPANLPKAVPIVAKAFAGPDPDVMAFCKAELGGSETACIGFDLLCFAMDWMGKQILPSPFGPFGPAMWPPLLSACGKAPLKCCQGIVPKPGGYPVPDLLNGGVHWKGPFDTKDGCWSAFNESSPINCEGNPAYGPTWSPGICKGIPGQVGCLCNIYPSCRTPTKLPPGATEPDVPPEGGENEVDVELEEDALLENTELAVKAQLFAPNYLDDFGAYRGCRDRNELEQLTDIPASMKVMRSDGTVDEDISAYQIQVFLIATRAIQSIPNGINRYTWIAARKWSPTQRAKYLARIGGDAKTELLKHMSVEAFNVIQSATPDWELLAVPLDGEAPPSPTVYDGCEKGTPTLAELSASVSGDLLTLGVHEVEADGVASMAPYNVQVRWGDGSVTVRNSITDQSFAFAHEYPHAGRYVVEVWTSNRAGLMSVSRDVITTASDASSALPSTLASVSAVDLDLIAAGVNFVPGDIDYRVEADGPDGDTTEALGHDTVTMAQEQDGYGRMVANGMRQVHRTLSFNRKHQTPVTDIVIRPFRRNQSSSPTAEIRLGDLGLTVLDAAGLRPRKIVFRPLPSDVEVHLSTGQIVPPQINAADGRLIFPATASFIKVAISSAKLDTKNLTAPVIPNDVTRARFAELLANGWVSVIDGGDNNTGASSSSPPPTLTYPPVLPPTAQPGIPPIPLDRVSTRTIDNVSGVRLDLALSIADYYSRSVTIDVSTIDGQNANHSIGSIVVPTPATSAMTRISVPSTLLPTTGSASVRGVRLKVTGAGPVGNRLRVTGLHVIQNTGAETATKPTFHDVIMLPAESEGPRSPIVDESNNEVLLPAKAVEAVLFIPDTATASDPSLIDVTTTRPIGCRPSFDGSQDVFVTAGGGCKDTRTGVVWSQSSPSLLTWHEAVWGSALANNAQPDANDDGRANDFDSGMTTTDASTLNYCHELVEGGYSDWVVPRFDDLANIFGPMLAGRYFGFDAWQSFHSSSSWDVNTSYIELLDNIATGGRGFGAKATQRFHALCVRRDHPLTAVCDPASAPRFGTTDAGCLDSQTHLVWSRPARRALTWSDAIWDSTFTGSPLPNADDGARINDYDPLALPPAADKDKSGGAYCHDLVEGGVSNWRVPTSAELLSLRSTNALSMDPTHPYQSSTTYGVTSYALGFSVASGSYAFPKTTEGQVICVRNP